MRLYASLASHMPEKTDGNAWNMEISESTTVAELLQHLKVPADAVKIIFLNGVHARGDEILKQGDRVGVFPPVAGG